MGVLTKFPLMATLVDAALKPSLIVVAVFDIQISIGAELPQFGKRLRFRGHNHQCGCNRVKLIRSLHQLALLPPIDLTYQGKRRALCLKI